MSRETEQTMVPKSRSIELPRPRVMTVLSEIPDFPITVVKAGAGYGKTTAVSNYVRQSGLATRWVTIREGDRYGVRFVDKLSRAVLRAEVSDKDYERMLAAAHSPLTWTVSAEWAAELVTTYVHEEEILVIDDFHMVDDDTAVLGWVEHFIRNLPINVHVVFVTRTSPALPQVESLALRGEVLWIRERELAFTEDEVGFMFRGIGGFDGANGPAMERSQVRRLLQRTGGMAMVLSMLLRDWRQYGQFSRLQAALDEKTSIPEQVGRLFVGDLTPDQQDFLRGTSLLSPLEPALCDVVLGGSNSKILLREMERKGYIAIAEEGHGYELHPLVRDHLSSTLSHAEREQTVERAVTWLLERGEEARAISYLFDYPNETKVGQALFSYIPKYLEKGQVSTVQGWLDRLSLQTIQQSQGLLLSKAEVARHTNQFSEAIHYYKQAYELALQRDDHAVLARVEMGYARLYLDTIQPASATEHIRAARDWVARSDQPNRFSILQLEFENSINQGRVARARRLLRVLTTFQGAGMPNDNTDARLLLRMGRIHDVIAALKPRISLDPVDGRTAFSHREATLLLSLMYVMMGEGDKAKAQAERGYLVGHSLHAPFVSAVGYIRLGHAQHFLNPLSDEALASYQEAVGRMDELQVPRGKAEALLGLCLAHGFRHQFALAKFYAQEGIAIASTAGDVWMANLVRLSLVQVAVVNEVYDTAIESANVCVGDFEACGDPFLQTASRLWLALALFRMRDERCCEELERVLQDVNRFDCRFLIERPTFSGMRDIQALVPMLQAYQSRVRESQTALTILHRLGCEELEYHPGYTLRVQTLGNFSVWRGFQEVTRREWQREKARQLFQFLLTFRGTLMHREEICERLWGDVDTESAERDFKVALNALSSVVEPDKPGRGAGVFIVRQGSLYGLTNHEMLEVDRDKFLQRIRDAEGEADAERRRLILASAIELYRGDYLTEVRYESWCDTERDNLRTQFVRAATEYAALCYRHQHFAEAIAACERVTQMEPTWEDAYVWLMRTYGAMYNRSMVVQTFKTCERVLHEELGVPPMASTAAVYEEILGPERAS